MTDKEFTLLSDREYPLLGCWLPGREIQITKKRFVRLAKCSEGQEATEKQLSVIVLARGNQRRCLPSQKN